MAQIINRSFAVFRKFLEMLEQKPGGFRRRQPGADIGNGLFIQLAPFRQGNAGENFRRTKLVTQSHADYVQKMSIIRRNTMARVQKRADIFPLRMTAQRIGGRTLYQGIGIVQTGQHERVLFRRK